MSLKNRKTLLILIAILLLGGFLRFYRLTSVPPGLYPDEAINGNNAYEALESSNFKVFYPENNGREGLFINLISYSIKFFGLKPFSIRIVSAIIGFLTIFGLFLLAKELFASELIALFSSFFLAISFWHLNFSRIGFRAIFVPFITVFAFYFLFKYLREKNIADFLYSALFFGLGFYTYIAYRIIPLLVFIPLLLFFLSIKEKKERIKFIKTWIIFAFLVFIFILPLVSYFYQNPQALSSRTNDVSVFSTKNPLKNLLISTAKTAGMLFVRGDCNWRHNLACRPELFYIQQVLFIVGIFFGIKSIKNKRKYKNAFIFLFSWLIIMVIPEILTYEAIPHAIRSIGIIPAVFMVVGFGAFELFKVFEKILSKNKINLLVIILGGVLFFVTFYNYFFVWAKNKNTKNAFSINYLFLAKKINSLPRTTDKYIICDIDGVPVRDRSSRKRNLPMSTQSLMFLTNSFLPQERAYRHIHYVLRNEISTIPDKKNIKIFKLSQ